MIIALLSSYYHALISWFYTVDYQIIISFYDSSDNTKHKKHIGERLKVHPFVWKLG
jgi:hypothetical protein